MYGANPDTSNNIEHGYPNLATANRSITALYRHLSTEGMKAFSSSLSPDAVRVVHNPDLVIGVQRLASVIARHLGLPGYNILVTFTDNLPCPGRVELSDREGYYIELHSRYQDNWGDIPAILAHEITHVFLHRAGLSFPETHDNEILTDTVAVYLGIGWPCL